MICCDQVMNAPIVRSEGNTINDIEESTKGGKVSRQRECSIFENIRVYMSLSNIVRRRWLIWLIMLQPFTRTGAL